VNDPIPKGGYQAVLYIIQCLGDEGPETPLDLVPKLRHFGYMVEEEDGVEESPALSSGNYTHTELCEVLGFTEEDVDKLKLTEESTNNFSVDTSGKRVYDILDSDIPQEVKKAEISSLILLKLCEYDIDTRSRYIPDAFNEFLTKLWAERNCDEQTGRYQTPWNLDQIETEVSTEWNKEKLRFGRQRGLALGICQEGTTGGSRMLFPVLSEDIFQAVVFHMFEYYRTEASEHTPNMTDFYEQISKWYPVAPDVYEDNVLYRGMLSRNTKITQETCPVLWTLLNQREDYDDDDFRVNWLEGEDSWNDDIPYAEFELRVI
jgi:hypothetical protein